MPQTTWKTFDPKTDELKVGVRFRLSEREGMIYSAMPKQGWFYIEWDDEAVMIGKYPLELIRFPELQIEVPRVTISKAAIRELEEWAYKESQGNLRPLIHLDELKQKLDEMSE